MKTSKHSSDRRKDTDRYRAGHPTPEARDYTDEEMEFLKAVEEFKKKRRVRFPHATDYLAVLVSLGYRKVVEPGPVPAKRTWGF